MSQIVKMPQLGETVTEGTILSWLVKVGDSVQEDDPIVEISTDKVDTEVPSPFSGIVSALLVEKGATVEVGTPLLELDGNGEVEKNSIEIPEKEDNEDRPIETKKDDVKPEIKSSRDKKLSPVVRKLAEKNNVDLSLIEGTGEGGRITRKNIEAYIHSSESTEEVQDVAVSNEDESSLTDDNQLLESSQPPRDQKIPRLRKIIAENMILSKKTSAHVMTSVEVDFESIEQLRIENRESFKSTEGFSLTYLPFISRATVESLMEFPVVNSSFDLERGKFKLHEDINLGVAVDLNQEGLLVGTIKNTDSYNLVGVARKISDLSLLLRSGKYDLNDVTGSTFTISNNGSFNSYLTSPIINQPNVAILSAESIKKRAVVIETPDGADSISIRHMGLLSLTWDHRVFDGSTALLFLNAIKDKLEKSNWKKELH
ncbi:MAG: 2-oxo acid dehydrogenase subunit E2 [Candidatus Actinomarinales bacterium]|nr:MAG: 2-oxo acid dehydrogenase subunit E2 [Candidatus Actinomarinales bacterium]